MTEDQLIHQLVAQLQPVRRLPSASRRAATWLVVAMAYGLGASVVLGVRADVMAALHRSSFLVESAALIVVAAGAALWAFHRSIPGERALAFMLVVASGAVVWLVSLWSRPSVVDTTAGWICVARMTVLCAVPAVLGVALLRRSRPLEPRPIYRLGVFAAGAIAMVGTQFVCARDGAAHLLIWHVAPWLLAAALAGARLTTTRRAAS